MQSPQTMRAYVYDAWKYRGWNVAKLDAMPDKQILAIYRRLVSDPEVKKYLDVLKSTGCWCGGPKKKGHAFCKENCFRRLPLHLQKPLYRKFGDGFEQAYERALQFLQR